MPGNPVLTTLHATGLTRAALARWLGVSPSAVTMWASDQRPIPGPIRRLCTLAVHFPTVAATISTEPML